MADGWDWLEGLSGGVSGIVKGIDAGMAPLNTWESIRTKDLSNDRYEIGNQDIEYQQRARMGEDVPAWYGDWRDAAQSGYRKTTAGNERDIYGMDQQLQLARYLNDPSGLFQMQMAHEGLTPEMPEYRRRVAEVMSQFDAFGAIGAYDKMGVPAIENRNTNEQAALQYVQNWVRRNGPDPNAQVIRMPDGTIAVRDSTGEIHPMDMEGGGDAMVRLADMLSAKTPGDALSRGVKDEINIQKTNIDMMTALAKMRGDVTPTAAVQMFREMGTRANQLMADARQRLNAEMAAAAKDTMATDEEKAARDERIATIRTEMDGYRRQMEKNQQLVQQIVTRSAVPRLGGAPGDGVPGVAPRPQGDTTLNTRPPVGSILNRAAGIDENAYNMSGGGRPPYPRPLPARPEGPRNTGVRPIGGPQPSLGGMDANQLIAFLQAIGAINA